jgi:rhodanese-related sulfurtransferase
MLSPIRSVAVAVVLGVLCSDGAARDARLTPTVDPSLLPQSHRVDGDLYLTSVEAYRAVTTFPNIVLIDARTHEETMFNGVAMPMHRHIPYVVPDFDHSYDPAAQRYRLETNPDFVKAVDNLLIELNLDRKATLIIYCSLGERSARAANLLNRSGFGSVYSMVDGFDGHPEGKAGLGWKANGLPWTYALKASQAYKSPTM